MTMSQQLDNTDELPIEIINMLRLLSHDLVLAQQDPNSTLKPATILTKAAPLFAALNRVNRSVLLESKGCKARTQEARLQMDSQHLRLQNLMFERNHLIREIKQCQEFESEYTSLPLLPEPDFLALAASASPPPGLRIPTPDDAHDLMLARLEFEKAERARFDEEKKALGAQKALLVKENEAKKRKLEELEKQLDAFVASARAIQTKIHEADDAARAKGEEGTKEGEEVEMAAAE